MREQARDKERLLHILDAIANVKEFTDGISREMLFNDKMRYYAVVKNIEIIGEASYMLSTEFKENHNELPWKAIVGMRHVIVHDYVNIHEDLLWDTVTNDLIPLQQQIEIYLSEFNQ